MEEDELSLPTLPKTSSDPQLPLNRPANPLKPRKRLARNYDLLVDDDAYASSLHTSSDPALFSSDETPDAENYSGGKRRKKKTYAGTWWGERRGKTGSFSSNSSKAAGRRTTKRKFTRNVDSGIFMCSDDGSTDFSSDSSLGAELIADQRRTEEETQMPRTPPPTQPSRTSKLSLSFTSASPQSPRVVKKPTVVTDPRVQRGREVIRAALDEGHETIDLSNMQLESLPPEIREIVTMVKNGPSDTIHGDSFIAEPRLYLSNNLFRQFPSPVLDLSNLRELSLRQNKLTHIPPGIRNLTQLQNLNLCGNRLQSLPIEILDLMTKHHLVQILWNSNPWLDRHDHVVQPLDLKNPRHRRVSAQLRLRDRVLPQPNETQSSFLYHTPLTLVASNTTPSETVAQRMVPSLSEMILCQLALHNPSKRDLSTLMDDDSPCNVTEKLRELHRAQNDGGRQCAYCGRSMVIPARKWIEWWDIVCEGFDTRRTLSVARTGNDYDTLKIVIPSPGMLVLPFEVAVCGVCE